MSIFRLIEGLVTTRETRKLGDFSFCNPVGSPVAPGVDVLYDFGGLRRDVTIWPDQRVFVKFNSASRPAFQVEAGPNLWSNEYADKVYVTYAAPTNMRIFANG